jgi:hypothetical protein
MLGVETDALRGGHLAGGQFHQDEPDAIGQQESHGGVRQIPEHLREVPDGG